MPEPGAGTSLPISVRVEAASSRRLISGPLRSIAVGALSVGLALAAKAIIEGLVNEDIAFLPLFAVLPLAALAGGFTAGAIVSALGATGVAVLFQEPLGSVFVDDAAALVRLVLYVPVSLWVAWLIAGIAESRRQMAARAGCLQRLIDALRRRR